jgi:hypothetical protein
VPRVITYPSGWRAFAVDGATLLPAWARRLVGVRTLFELSVGIAVLVDVAPLFVTYECL